MGEGTSHSTAFKFPLHTAGVTLNISVEVLPSFHSDTNSARSWVAVGKALKTYQEDPIGYTNEEKELRKNI